MSDKERTVEGVGEHIIPLREIIYILTGEWGIDRRKVEQPAPPKADQEQDA